MKSFKDKLRNFFSDKKNIKIVVVALIVIVTAVGIVLGVTITPAGGSEGKAGPISSGNNNNTNATGSATDPNDPVALANLANAGSDKNAASDNTFSINQVGGVNGTAGILYDANGNPVSMYGVNEESTPVAGGGNAEGGGETSNDPSTVVCTIAVDCSQVSGNGVLTAAGFPELEPYAANPSILSSRNITVTDANGDGRVTVEEAIKQACNTYGIQYEFKGSSYLRGMNYLYEFNAGPNSGWMYQVNGKAPNKGCNSYYLKGGEDVLWYYVISY